MVERSTIKGIHPTRKFMKFCRDTKKDLHWWYWSSILRRLMTGYLKKSGLMSLREAR